MGREEVLKVAEEGRHMEALEGLWKLGKVYGFHSLFPRMDSLRDIVLGACRQAVEALRRGDLERVRSWLERLSGDVPSSVVDLGDGADRASWRARVVRAHLLCVKAALEMHWPSGTVGKGALEEIARECGLQGCFVEEIAGAVLGLSGREVEKKESIIALLVSEDREGVAGYLELEVLGSGRGELFPSSEMAFVFRDEEFEEAEGNACAWAYENGWDRSTDVRWSLKLPDGRTPTSLSGGSAGGAFAVGLAKLFSKSAELIELGGTAVSAAVDK